MFPGGQDVDVSQEAGKGRLYCVDEYWTVEFLGLQGGAIVCGCYSFLENSPC